MILDTNVSIRQVVIINVNAQDGEGKPYTCFLDGIPSEDTTLIEWWVTLSAVSSTPAGMICTLTMRQVLMNRAQSGSAESSYCRVKH